MTPLKQTGNPLWKDEAGIEIPANRIRKSEKLREVKAHSLIKEALAINETLKEFKETIRMACNEVTAAVRAEADLKESKEGKGNFTWFNFDRSVKVECSINERITFDDTEIAICKEKLDEFLTGAMKGSENAEMIQELVKDAFSNTKGRLDAKKVMSLLKYETRITSKLYAEAMIHLKKSIRRPDSTVYYRVALRNAEGGYDYVELNFSAI